MNKRCLVLAVCVCLAAGTAGRAIEMVKTAKNETFTGRIVSVTRFAVEVDKNSVVTSIPVNEIVSVQYDNEPSLLKTVARSHLTAGRYNDALEALAKLNPAELGRPEITQEVEYFTALCKAKLAMGGSGTLEEARDALSTFVHGNINSYHFFEGCEMLGNLHTALGQYEKAETYYGQLSKSPWPDYQMRGGVAIGRAQLAQGKTAEALQAFDSVLAMTASGDMAQSQRLAARLGKASCAAAGGQTDQAIAMVEKIIAEADPENVELHARAYNTLGGALRKAGETKKALLAFLHVDVLYFAVPEAHAEALANLVELWNETNKTERAVRARKILQEQYQNSPWAKKAGG